MGLSSLLHAHTHRKSVARTLQHPIQMKGAVSVKLVGLKLGNSLLLSFVTIL